MAIFSLIFWLFSVTNSLEFIEGLGLSDTYHQIAHKTFVQQAKLFVFPSRIPEILHEFLYNSNAICSSSKDSVYIWIAVEYQVFFLAKANGSWILQKFSKEISFLKDSN